jgi:ATP-dependent RNA helicase DeaD
MLNMGFEEDLEAILKTVPEGVRTLLFSATMPERVTAIAGRHMKAPEEITVGERNSGSETVRHEYYMVHAHDRYAALKRIIDMAPAIYGIVFCRTRQETQELASKLLADGYNADALHGDLSQAQRDRVMDGFRVRALEILVATDVAARGLDVTDLTHVINYSLPDGAMNYTHRSGRTGRAGKPGVSVLILNMREAHKIGILERIVKKKFQYKPVPSGSDVCAAQLHGMLERIRRVEVNEADLAPYMGQIRALLTELSGEDVLKRFVSVEFNRFLDYYKDAADLNVSRPPVRHPDGPARPARSVGHRKDGNMTGLSINLGRRNGVTPSDLMGLINRTARAAVFDVGRIMIGNDRSFLEVSGGDVNVLIKASSLPSFNGRRVRFEALQAGDSDGSHASVRPHGDRGAARRQQGGRQRHR